MYLIKLVIKKNQQHQTLSEPHHVTVKAYDFFFRDMRLNVESVDGSLFRWKDWQISDLEIHTIEDED